MTVTTKSIFLPDLSTGLLIPLVLERVCAGFPSPAEDYLEGRIDLNRELIKSEFSTFYFRMSGDSMEPEIKSGSLLVVDKMEEASDGDVIVARLGGDFCVRIFRVEDNGRIRLYSINRKYKPIDIDEGCDFEVWGSVLHAIHSFKNLKITPTEIF